MWTDKDDDHLLKCKQIGESWDEMALSPSFSSCFTSEQIRKRYYNSNRTGLKEYREAAVAAAATKKKIGKKKISNREQSRLDGNGSFKSFSEVNFNNLCHDLKNKVNVMDNATFNNTETMVNFDPTNKRHLELKSVVSKQTFSCTIPVTNALSELLALYSTDGKFDPERFFETFMRNCNPLAEIQLGVSYKKADISGFSKNNYQLQARGNEFLIKLANCIGITEQDIVVRSMIQAMGGSGKEMNFHRDDTALLRVLVSVTEEKGCILGLQNR